MKLRELKEIINKIEDKYSEADVLIDTECAFFNVHMVEIKSVTLIDSKFCELMNCKPFIEIQLDDSVKTH